MFTQRWVALGGRNQHNQCTWNTPRAWLSHQASSERSCRAVLEEQAAKERDLSFWTAFGTIEPQQRLPPLAQHTTNTGKEALCVTLQVHLQTPVQAALKPRIPTPAVAVPSPRQAPSSCCKPREFCSCSCSPSQAPRPLTPALI